MGNKGVYVFATTIMILCVAYLFGVITAERTFEPRLRLGWADQD